MCEATIDRLNDLNNTAKQLTSLLDAHGGKLPGMLVARASVCIDDAASKLAQHLARLTSAMDKGKG